MLLHFVLTRCMRLLGNSPYAPFIYNSAANAGHAGPHPRSVIRLRRRCSETRRLNSGMMLIERAHACTDARTHVRTHAVRMYARTLASRARIFRGDDGPPLLSPFSPAISPFLSHRRPLRSDIAGLVINTDHTTERKKYICIIFFGKGRASPLSIDLSLPLGDASSFAKLTTVNFDHTLRFHFR